MSTDSERELARSHFEQFLAEPRSFPMSVNIGGRCYEGIGPAYTLVSESTESSSQSVTVRRVYAHETGLQLELTLKQYPEYAAYEWSASLVNPSALPSPLVTEWEIASLTLPAANAKLCGILGDGGFHNDPYSPYEIQLSGASVTQFSPSGRGTYGRFPYFNISGDGGGFFFVIGWPGKWQASFSENNGLVTARARQKTLAARIPPKGRLISPLAVVLEYQGNDIDRAQNLWRRFFIDCNMRRPGGKLPEPHISGGTSWIYGEMKDATDENQINGIRQYLDHGVPIDYWWMDAGWYYKTGEESLDVWLPVGTWVVDRKRFPSGMRAITDYAHRRGVKALLWFEPEVCRLRTEELGPTSVKPEWIIPGTVTRLMDIGDPDFRKFMLDRVYRIMDEGGIDTYRQDYGVGYPTDEMHAADPPGESGLVENRYMQGYYAYLEAIAEHYPDKLLDACAAGGGRNDIRTMRLCVPLHKTDADYSNYTMKTSMHQALFAWLPYFGTPVSGPGPLASHPDTYIMRCNVCPFVAMGADTAHPDQVDWEVLRKGALEWARVKDFFYADYYPLVKWDGSASGWRGWEFFDAAGGAGFFELIRDSDADDSEKTVKLKGLDPGADYRLIPMDGAEREISGSEGLSGIRVSLPEKRSAQIWLIQKVS